MCGSAWMDSVFAWSHLNTSWRYVFACPPWYVSVPSCFPYELQLKTKTRLPTRISWRQSIRAADAPAVGRYERAGRLSQAGVCAVRCWQWVSAGRRPESSAQSGQRLGSGVTVGSVDWFLSYCLGCRSWTAMQMRGVWVGDCSSAAGLMFDLLQQFSSRTQLCSSALGFSQSLGFNTNNVSYCHNHSF